MVARGVNFGRYGAVTFNPSPASGPEAQRITVPSADVLPLFTLNALLARAGGSLDALAGMNVSDADANALFSAALADAAAARAAGMTVGVPWSPDPFFSSLDRAWNDSLVVFWMPQGFGQALSVNVSASQPGTSAAMFRCVLP